MTHNRLLLAIFAGAIAGVACGWLFGQSMTAIGWLGQLFLDALKMTLIPLVTAAVISAITTIGDLRKLGRVGALTVVYYISTTGIAVLIGLVLVNAIAPGVGVDTIGGPLPDGGILNRTVTVPDMILSLVTPNLIDAAAKTQLLPIIVFCVLFAVALNMTGQSTRPVAAFFEALNEVMMKIVMWIMYFSPIGVFALIASTLGKVGGSEFVGEIAAVGRYISTVLLGLALHFCVLFGLLLLLARRGREYLVGMLRALLTAFGTASSAATLPLTLDCVTSSGVDRRVARFLLPLGATINMDGTALYQAVAAMFVAQAYGLELGLGQQAVVFVTATLASIGTAAIPQAGLVNLMIVFSAVNLPAEGIGLILAVDWFVDRCRTTVNVWGDCVGTAVVERLALAPRSQSAVHARDEIA